MHKNGIGVQQNDEPTVYWFRKAAEYGNADVQEALNKLGIDWNK